MDPSAAVVTASPEQTRQAAARFARLCRSGDVVGLKGTLGAGKTCFVKGLARGLGVGDERRVVSPTFVLLRRYEGRLTLYHFDAYRLRNAREMEEIGCREIFEAGGLSVVEWADHVSQCLPEEHFMLHILVTGQEERTLRLDAVGEGPGARIAEMLAALAG